MTDRKLIIANLLQRAMNALLYAHIPSLDDYQELKYVIIEYDEVLRETLAQTERIAQLEHDLKAEREACAAICDRFQARDVGMQPAECAGAIRARGEK